jgi:hypothetical protein
MRICIVNKQIGVKTSPTGYHAWHLANRLSQANFQVVLISESTTDDIPPTDNMEVVSLSRSYQGKQKWWRLISSFKQAYLFIRRSSRSNSAVYIILSDPPFLNYWASRILKKEKRIYWTMDVYPDAFIAAGYIAKENILFKHYQKTIDKNLPDLFLTLGEHQSNYIRTRYRKPEMLSCPIGITEVQITNASSTPNWYHDGKMHIGYVGTLGEAHDPRWLTELVRRMNANTMRLVIKANGSKAQQLIAQLSDETAVEVVPYVLEEELPWIDIQMVILKKVWTHISVPSKGISAVMHGCPVLFCGDSESDTWQYIQSCGWQLDDFEELSNWLKTLDIEKLVQKRKHTNQLAERLIVEREEAYLRLIAFINDNAISAS